MRIGKEEEEMGEWAKYEAIREDQERALSCTNFEKILKKILNEFLVCEQRRAK